MDKKNCNRAPFSRGRILAGLPGLGGSPFILSIILVGWSCMGVVAAGVGIPREHPLQIRDPVVPSSSEEWNLAELSGLLANAEPQERERKLGDLLEWMHRLRQQQQYEREEAAMVAAAIESEMSSGDGLKQRIVLPPPLMHSSGGSSSRVSPPGGQIGAASGGGEEEGEDEGKGKRGSFMSLCHFKICNMGRKRNLRYNPWTRV